MGGWVVEVFEEFQNWEVVEVGGLVGAPHRESSPGRSSPQDKEDDRSPPPRVLLLEVGREESPPPGRTRVVEVV